MTAFVASYRCVLLGCRLVVTASDVAVVFDGHMVLAARNPSMPAIEAAATAHGLRIASTLPGQRPILRGYASGVLAAGCARTSVSGIIVESSREAGIVVGDESTVRDVLVRGGKDGVLLGHLGTADAVVVRGSAGRGIAAGDRASVVGCDVSGHAGIGIDVGAGSVVTDSRAANEHAGFRLGRGSLARSVIAVCNVEHGIDASYSCMVARAVAEMNGGDGIVVDDGSEVESSIANDNAGTGVRTGKGCLVRGVVARTNLARGLAAGAGTSIVDSSASNGFVGVHVLDRTARFENVVSFENAFGLAGIETAPPGLVFDRIEVAEIMPADRLAELLELGPASGWIEGR